MAPALHLSLPLPPAKSSTNILIMLCSNLWDSQVIESTAECSLFLLLDSCVRVCVWNCT